jgi:hypothetical protein
MVALVKHDQGCPYRRGNRVHSDAAKRIYDTYHLHRSAGELFDVIGKWFASALADGSTDGVLYDSRMDAITHQHHNESYFTFVQVTPASITVCNAEVMLEMGRKFDAKLLDRAARNGGRQLIKRSSIEDMMSTVRGYPTNLEMPREN